MGKGGVGWDDDVCCVVGARVWASEGHTRSWGARLRVAIAISVPVSGVWGGRKVASQHELFQSMPCLSLYISRLEIYSSGALGTKWRAGNA